jgi:hypothetical protein
MLDHGKDKFGFYTVGNLKFYSKFDAATTSGATGQPMSWNFNDELYSLHDWTSEPVDSLPELYRRRAQQLRDEYDYLVLWYSGGADSDNILDTFVNNNIPLDEAAGVVNYEATGDREGFLNAEIYHLTVPKIEQIRNTSQPWLLHTLIDLAQPTMDYFNNPNNKFDWIYQVSQYVNPNYMARAQIVKSNSRWMDMINAGKKVAFIWGIDKPKVIGINGQFTLVFRDVLDSAPITYNQLNGTPGVFDEMFYWTPDLPEIVIKQAHVLKNFLKNLSASSEFLTTKQHDRMPAVTIDNKMYWLKFSGVHTALYPTWHPRPYQFKPSSLIFSERDMWFFKLSDSDPAKQMWKQGIEYRWQKTPDFLKNNPASLKHGYKLLQSRPYNLGT